MTTTTKERWTMDSWAAMEELRDVSGPASRLFMGAQMNPKKRRVLDVVVNANDQEVLVGDRLMLNAVEELRRVGLARETSRRNRRPYDKELGWDVITVYVSVPELV